MDNQFNCEASEKNRVITLEQLLERGRALHSRAIYQALAEILKSANLFMRKYFF
jgi:hypothetical protein